MSEWQDVLIKRKVPPLRRRKQKLSEWFENNGSGATPTVSRSGEMSEWTAEPVENTTDGFEGERLVYLHSDVLLHI